MRVCVCVCACMCVTDKDRKKYRDTETFKEINTERKNQRQIEINHIKLILKNVNRLFIPTL